MSVKLLNEHNMEFLSLTGDCRDSSESTLVKMSHCWKTNVTAQLVWKHNMEICKIVFFCLYQNLDFFRVLSFFHGVQNSVLFSSSYSRD